MMFRGFSTLCLPGQTPEEIVRLALSGRFYGIELAVAPGEMQDAERLDRNFYEAGLTVAAVDPGLDLSVPEARDLGFRLIDFAASVHSRGLIISGVGEESRQILQELCCYAGEQNVQVLTETLPEEEIPNLMGVWDISDPGPEPPLQRIGHVRISNFQMDEALLQKRMLLLRRAGFRGFITLTEPICGDPLTGLFAYQNRIDTSDEKAALADVPLPPLYPPEGHPRVMFQKKDIPAIRRRMEAPENRDAVRRYREALLPEAEILLPEDTKREMEAMTPEQLQQCKNRDRGMGAADSKYQHIRADILDRIEIRAFAYAIEGREDMGRSAVEGILVYLKNCVALVYDDLGQLIYTAAEVYDWCYPLFTFAQREELAEQVIELARRLEIGWPPLKQSALAGHGVESQLFRDLFAFGIALRDEHPEIYDVSAGLLMWQFIPARRFFNMAHMNMQGGQYTIYRGPWEFICTGLLRGMGMPDLFGPSQGHLLDWLLWARRPDGVCLVDGDNSIHNLPPVDHFEKPGNPEIPFYTDELDWLTYGRRPAIENGEVLSDMLYDNTAKRCYVLAASLYQNPYYKEEARLCMPGFRLQEPYRNRTMNTVEFLLFNDPYLQRKPLDQLPKLQYFPFPKGSVLVRTGWSVGRQCRDVLCEMKVNELWSTGHQHQDAGAFQLYYKGMLAIDSGYYQSKIVIFDWEKRKVLNNGNTGCNGVYDNNYNKATIAHNCVLVLDPEEDGPIARPMGGQPLMTGGYRNLETYLKAEQNQIGQVIGFGNDRGITFLSGEISRAYGSKVSDYTRSFAFVEFPEGDCPAALVVFDDITSSNKDFRKFWLCHGINAPRCEGSRSVFSVTERGYNGRLTIDTLLPVPENLEMCAVTDPEDFDVFGVKYPAALFEGRRNDAGACRIMVSPKTPRERDCFLHVLQVSDGDAGIMEQPVLLEGSGFRGVLLRGTAVLFLEGECLEMALELPKSCARVMLCGISGLWQWNGETAHISETSNYLVLENCHRLQGRKL